MELSFYKNHSASQEWTIPLILDNGADYTGATPTVEEWEGDGTVISTDKITVTKKSDGAYILTMASGTASNYNRISLRITDTNMRQWVLFTSVQLEAQKTILNNIGTPVALDGGALTIAAMLTKMADDNGGVDFDATNDSLNKISDAIAVGSVDWSALERENIRNALGIDGTKTAPTGGYGRIGNPAIDLSADIAAISSKIGTPVALDGGSVTIAAMLTKMADDNGGADFDATDDSLNKISDAIAAGSVDWSAIEKENIRHALGIDGTKTIPTGGYGRIGNPTGADLATDIGNIIGNLMDLEFMPDGGDTETYKEFIQRLNWAQARPRNAVEESGNLYEYFYGAGTTPQASGIGAQRRRMLKTFDEQKPTLSATDIAFINTIVATP